MKNAIWIVATLCGAGLAACGHTTGDLARDTYPGAQAQVKQRLDEIWAAAEKKDIARLESFHLYGPKFTEFKDGAPRGDAAANQQGEKEVINMLSDTKVEMSDLVVNVFGEVAVATFNGAFSGKMGGKPVAMKEQSTMIFVKVGDDWKIVHEHFSPLGTPPPGA